MHGLSSGLEASCAPNAARDYENLATTYHNVHNFFANFSSAQKFLRSLDRWECCRYDSHLKPGLESFLPNWLTRYLLASYFAKYDLDISPDPQHTTALCNWLFNGAVKHESILSSYALEGATLPHIDYLPSPSYSAYICLVNINDYPVSTDFWRFNSSRLCGTPEESKKLQDCIVMQSRRYLSLTTEERAYFSSSVPNLFVEERVTYSPNSAIIYPAHAYHSPVVNPKHTSDCPRGLLRLTFRVKNSTSLT